MRLRQLLDWHIAFPLVAVLVTTLVERCLSLTLGNGEIREPSYQDALACSSQISSISKEMNNLMLQNQRMEIECKQRMDYYEGAIKSVELAKSIYKRSAKGHDSEAEITATYQQRYQNLMCSKVYDAFHLGEKDSRMDVLHLCTNRTSLSLRSTSLRVRRYGDALRISTCPAAQELERKMNTLRAAVQRKGEQCKANVSSLKTKLGQLRAEEDDLEDRHFAHYDNKSEIRDRVGSEVTTRFCKVIMSAYGMNESIIEDFWALTCARSNE